MGAVFGLVLIWLIIELVVWYVIAQFVSGWWVFLWFIAAFFIGLNLLRVGMKNVSPMAKQMQTAGMINPAMRPPESVMTKSISLVVAGLLLAVPGVLSDLLAVLLLLPPVQKKAKNMMDGYMQKNQQKMMQMMAERMKNMNIDPSQFGGDFGGQFGGGLNGGTQKSEGFKGKHSSGFGGVFGGSPSGGFGTFGNTVEGEAKVVNTKTTSKDVKKISQSANDED